MSRPKDENGKPLPAAHVRLPNIATIEERAIFKLSEDARLARLTLARKLTLVRACVDHLVDGGKIPGWVSAPDKDWPGNRVLMEAWRTAEREIRAEMAVAA